MEMQPLGGGPINYSFIFTCIIEFRSVNTQERISWWEFLNVIGLMMLSGAWLDNCPWILGRATSIDRTRDLCDTNFLMTTRLKVLCWVQIIPRSSSSWSLQVRRIMINGSVCFRLPAISSPVISSHSDDSIKTPDLYVTVAKLCFFHPDRSKLWPYSDIEILDKPRFSVIYSKYEIKS